MPASDAAHLEKRRQSKEQSRTDAVGTTALPQKAAPASGCAGVDFCGADVTSLGMTLRICLLACLGATALCAAPIKHEFIAIDEGKTNLLYVNENDPAKNWIVPIGKSHPRDMQLVGGHRILFGNITGYSEFEIATGKRLVDVTNFAPADAKTDTDEVTSVRRQPNGHTLVAGENLDGSKGVVVLDVDSAGAVKNKIVYPGNSYDRLLRQTAADTYLMVCDTTIREGDSSGKYVWEAPVEKFSHAWKAVRLPNGNTLGSAGYGGFMVELDPAKNVVRKFGGKDQDPAPINSDFFATFQLLPNGDVVVANWQGHGANHGNSGVQLVEFDKTGAIVWQWSKSELISSIQGILVLDNLNTAVLHDERNGIMEPVAAAPVTRLLAHFDHEVEEGDARFREPVRDAVGDDDHVAFCQMMGFAAGNVFGAEFARRFLFNFVRLAARDKSGGAIHDVKDIGVLFMDFHRSRTSAAPGHDFVIVGLVQHSSGPRKSGVDLLVRDEGDGFGLLGRVSEAEDAGGRERENGFG